MHHFWREYWDGLIGAKTFLVFVVLFLVFLVCIGILPNSKGFS